MKKYLKKRKPQVLNTLSISINFANKKPHIKQKKTERGGEKESGIETGLWKP